MGIDIFCASQAATSIRLSMDEGSSSSSSTSTIFLGGSSSGRAIDRYNPIIRDASRIGKVLQTTPRAPCNSDQPPINPKPQHNKKSHKKKPSKENIHHHNHQSKKIISSKENDIGTSDNIIKKSSWSCTKPGAFVTPPGSSRYLLSTEKSFLSDHFDPLLAVVPVEASKIVRVVDKKDNDESSSATAISKPTSSSSSSASASASSPDQVVVLRVSLHCRGCERKMRKHLSRMEGVTSFNIDFATKKLTVVGDVTPLAVLASVSKVKNAQLLTPPLSSSIPPVCSNISGISKDKGIVV